MSYRASHISDVTEVWQPTEANEAAWKAVRHHFGIGAFGVNAFVARADGGDLIEPHDEADGHEELYVVLDGHARFTIDGEVVDAPAGTLVHVSPESHRQAAGVTAGTTVLVVGAEPGKAFEPSAWELRYTQPA
jgi:quercetin dioxygenase-like cupin family protein